MGSHPPDWLHARSQSYATAGGDPTSTGRARQPSHPAHTGRSDPRPLGATRSCPQPHLLVANLSPTRWHRLRWRLPGTRGNSEGEGGRLPTRPWDSQLIPPVSRASPCPSLLTAGVLVWVSHRQVPLSQEWRRVPVNAGDSGEPSRAAGGLGGGGCRGQGAAKSWGRWRQPPQTSKEP